MENFKETILNEKHKVVRRGYDVDDEKLFIIDLEKMKKAKEIICYLLNNGFNIKSASMYVTQHYMLNERQRLALARICAKDEEIISRKNKQVKSLDNKEVYIDGFNAIIPLESLLSDSILLKGMDGAIRDLANLKGSYKIIDKTKDAICLLLQKLDDLNVKKAHIYLDKPISNSGRLKTLIGILAENYNVEVDIELLYAVDKALYDKENVISGDCVVIDESISWYPLYMDIVNDYAKKHNIWLLEL